ncbi:phage tail protein [Shewanella baltica]|uniref:phage tail-collar fiber domain-containing protein n=1 Tax=Shewanella baltica TaxID=62322 RepID=UPI0039B0108D
MAQVITLAGERLFALKAQNNQQLDIDTFIFAYVPGQDSTVDIDRNEGLPPVGQRVHTQIVQQYGMLGENAVVYSSVLDSLTGPFQFNWVGLYSAVNQTLIAIQHIPTVSKTVTEPGASGNILNRNFVIEYSGIAELTGITVDPTTWQYDFEARLNGMDELTRQLAADMNGKDWFIDDGFKVVPRSTLNTFKVTAGVGYISGLRVELTADHILTLSSYPQFVYVDAWFEATSESIWKGKVAFTVTNTEMDDYIDVNGRNHYVFKLARITAADVVEDLRNVDGLKQQSDKNAKSIYFAVDTMSSYQAENCVPAMKESLSKLGYIYFAGNKAENNIYNIIGDHPELYGSTVHVDHDAKLIFDYDYYAFLGSLNIVGNCECYFESKNFKVKTRNIEDSKSNVEVNQHPQKITVVEFDDCHVKHINGDTFTDGVKGSESSSAILFEAQQGAMTALFAPIAIGETISAHMRVEIANIDKFGIILRCSNGWVRIYNNKAQIGAWQYDYKPKGGAVVVNTQVNTPDNNLISYAAGKASFGIALESKTRFSFIINGCSGNATLESDVGEIHEVGFFSDGNASGAVVRLTGLCAYSSDAGIFGKAPLNILIHGDSTAEKWLGSFDRYLPQALDGVNGCRTISITNKAVAGETFRQQLDKLKIDGPGNAYVIMMVAGTNEGQGGVNADTFAAMCQEFIDYCVGLYRIPMLVEPWMWYSKDYIGGAGQSSSNFENVAELREAGKRVALANNVPYVSTTHSLPAPIPYYFNIGLEPLLRDNIHQSFLGYQLYAERIASEIARWWFAVDKTPREIADFSVASNVVVSDSEIDENRVIATINVSGFVNGQTVLNLPRWCRPNKQLSWPAVFTRADGTYASCRTLYQNGALKVDGLDITTAVIVLNVSW